MNWTFALIVVAVAIVILVLKRVGQISRKEARAYLERGALVVDVRSPAEFNSGHLSNAINVPLEELETVLPRRVKDKQQVSPLPERDAQLDGQEKIERPRLCERLQSWFLWPSRTACKPPINLDSNLSRNAF
jgi:hypothetical protein